METGLSRKKNLMKIIYILLAIMTIGCARDVPPVSGPKIWKGSSGYFYYIDLGNGMLGIGSTGEVAKMIAEENSKDYKGGGLVYSIQQRRSIQIVLKSGNADVYSTVSKMDFIAVLEDKIILNNSIITKVSHSKDDSNKLFNDLKDSNYNALNKAEGVHRDNGNMFSEFSRNFMDELTPSELIP